MRDKVEWENRERKWLEHSLRNWNTKGERERKQKVGKKEEWQGEEKVEWESGLNRWEEKIEWESELEYISAKGEWGENTK